MKKHLRIFEPAGLLMAFCCLLLGTAATSYVSTAGTEYGDGSSTNPWQTIGQALSECSSGDFIDIAPGEYREFLLITNSVILSGRDSYSAGNPYLQRHNSETVIRAPFTNLPGRIITIMTNNVTIQNLTIYGDPFTNGAGSVLQGIYTSYRPLNISSCKIANIYGRAVECRGTNTPLHPSDNDSLRSYFGYNLISNISHSNYADGFFLEHTAATCEFNEFYRINTNGAHAGIYARHCYYTTNMSAPLLISSNYFRDCTTAIWANDPGTDGEKVLITGNTIENGLIGIRVTFARGQATVAGNHITVSGISTSGLTPARGIWIHADFDPWNAASETDHLVYGNRIYSDALDNNGTIGMLFAYDTLTESNYNNGVRATVLSNLVYNFATGSMIVSGTNEVSQPADPLVEVVYHYNDIGESAASPLITTGFAYIVDATSNFLGYTDPSSVVSTNVNFTGWTLGSLYLDTDMDSLLDFADPDDDDDGLDDISEIAIGTSPVRWDSDSDGMNDPSEYFVAGTDPADPASVLAMAGFLWTPTNGASFSWPSVTGRTYYVYRTTNMTEGFAAPITNFPATAPTNYYNDPSATGETCFFRISVTN